LAGAAAMKAALWLWHSATENDPRQGAYGLDDKADIDSAKMLSKAVAGVDIADDTAKAVGVAMHYAYGAGAGAIYALWAEEQPVVRSGMGTAYGALLWLTVDEIGVTATGLSDPRRKSFASHAAALGVHLLYGWVVETIHERIGL
jgi:uncharacterized membrane protein YagU involved in acid resistance